MSKLKKTSKYINSLLYQLVRDVHRIFSENAIPYWMDGGTFLGAVRHGGIIPWDDDIDICVLEVDEQRLLNLSKRLKELGYRLVKDWFGYKICYKNIKNIRGFTYSFPFLDIFLMKQDDDKLIPSKKEVIKMWPKEYSRYSETFPLKLYKFGDFYLWGPKKYNYLKRMYGKDWYTVAYRQYDHEKEQDVEKVKVKLTDKDRVPAKPIKTKKRAKIRSRDSDPIYQTICY